MIEVRDITVRFGGVTPLDRLTLSLTAPLCGLIGPNGAGKTTLLDVFSGFVRPAAGAIVVDDQALSGLSARRRARWGMRRTFQTDAVIDRLSAADNVICAREHLGDGGEGTEELLDFVGFDGPRHGPAEVLSTAQRRLLEIARALVGRPRLILIDEPGAGMGREETGRLATMLAQIPGRFEARVLLIDHDLDLVSAVCSELAVLDFGKLVAAGPTREVLSDERVRAAYLGTATI